MKVLMVSKALVSAAYRQKLTEIARLGAEVVAVVPPEWKEGRGQRFEPSDDLSYRVIVTPLRFNGRFHLHYYPALPRIMRRERPELVHIDEEPYNLATFLGSRVAVSAGVPSLFFTWQNLSRRYPPPFRQFESYVYRGSAYAIAGSEDAATILRLKGFARDVSVIPQFGVDPDMFCPGGAPDGPFTIGFFNRLIPGKAPLLLLDAMAVLPDDAHLLMAGDGPLHELIQREIRRRGLHGRVELRPRAASSDMPALLRRVHVSVLPSVTTPTWKEQFGRILVESMAAGVPVVGSASGEIPSVIGDAGLIVPEGDASELAGAIARIYGDSALRNELSSRGRARVLTRYTHARIAEQTVAAYDRVLSTAPA